MATQDKQAGKLHEPLPDRTSGGEEGGAEVFRNLRALINREQDVLEVLALSWIPQEGQWLYLIKTPFATWPKFVVGLTDAANESPQIIFRCGYEVNARECFNEQNFGDHQ